MDLCAKVFIERLIGNEVSPGNKKVKGGDGGDSSSSNNNNNSTVVVGGGALLAHQQLRIFTSTSCQLVLEDIGLLRLVHPTVAVWRLNKR